MKRKFERYYKDDIKKQIYCWSNKTIVEWCRDTDKNNEQLFNILEKLCNRIYDIGYEDGYDD